MESAAGVALISYVAAAAVVMLTHELPFSFGHNELCLLLTAMCFMLMRLHFIWFDKGVLCDNGRLVPLTCIIVMMDIGTTN